ncbi:MAG: Hpt domain-containing protein [Candidatus Margulisiibacteriota bacterium]|jgi:HPt (histidine-containing phosphotransfer) domain-containing protein
MDLELLKKMFLTDLEEKVSQLELLFQEKNLEELKQIAHKIKGNSAGLVLNFQKANEIGRNLEQAIIKNQTTLIIQEIQNLKSFYINIK